MVSLAVARGTVESLVYWPSDWWPFSFCCCGQDVMSQRPHMSLSWRGAESPLRFGICVSLSLFFFHPLRIEGERAMCLDQLDTRHPHRKHYCTVAF